MDNNRDRLFMNKDKLPVIRVDHSPANKQDIHTENINNVNHKKNKYYPINREQSQKSDPTRCNIKPISEDSISSKKKGSLEQFRLPPIENKQLANERPAEEAEIKRLLEQIQYKRKQYESMRQNRDSLQLSRLETQQIGRKACLSENWKMAQYAQKRQSDIFNRQNHIDNRMKELWSQLTRSQDKLEVLRRGK